MIYALLSLPLAILGYSLDLYQAWVPLASFACNIVYAPFDGWVRSNRVGGIAALSVAIRLVLSMVGAAGMVFFWWSIGLALYWSYLAMTG